MKISNAKAQEIAQLSYDICHYYDEMENLITYEKALEFDELTGDKILDQLKTRNKKLEFNKFFYDFNVYKKFYGREIIIIDNYQYVDYIEYDYNKIRDIEIVIKFLDGEKHTFTVPYNGKAYMKLPKIDGYSESRLLFYIPHIYKHAFYDNCFVTDNLRKLSTYLGAIIAEDRLLNPYLLNYSKYKYVENADYKKVILPMKEAIEFIYVYEKEIELLNLMLPLLYGEVPYNRISGTIDIPALRKYFEHIGKGYISERLAPYEHDIRRLEGLQMILDYTEKEIYGLIFAELEKHLVLL